MNLQETLTRLREDPANKPAVRRAIADTVEALRQSGAAEAALRVGDTLPDFLLPDTEGRLVGRHDLLHGRGVVLTFFRGHWCPFCTAALTALERALPEIVALDARLVAVTPETGGRAANPRGCGNGYSVLSDVDHGLAMACGVAFSTPLPYRRLLTAAGLDLGERQGHAGWFLPVPATFVLDAAGVVRWAFVEVDFTRRAEPHDILEVLRSLSGQRRWELA